MKYLVKLIVSLFVVLCLWSTPFAAPLDLSTFTAETEFEVGVDLGTGVVSFVEGYAAGYFYDDFFLVPDDATILSFDYDLSWGPDDFNDYLVLEVDFSREMDVFSPITGGHFEIDLTSYRTSEISLAWGLIWDGDDALGSTASIFNIDLATENEQSAPVPEPGTMMLLGTGLVGLAGFRRKIQKK